MLANHTRLRIFGLLVEESPLTVSSVAHRLHLTLPVASQGLRALEARSLLAVRRVGRRVQYELSAATTTPVQSLVRCLRASFRDDPNAARRVFRLATAFTHPRRIEILRVLQTHQRTLEQIRVATRISGPALVRHLAKLEARGFVARKGGLYVAVCPEEPISRALAQLAADQ